MDGKKYSRKHYLDTIISMVERKIDPRIFFWLFYKYVCMGYDVRALIRLKTDLNDYNIKYWL